ncbi:MAG: acetyltransferase [Spirochaetaceae bacterium]|nr:MAG: acetyltransferase [Spirochaetaceae bacterium]
MRLIILGAGGHARACGEIAERSGRFAAIAYADNALPKGTPLAGGAVEYSDAELGAVDTGLYQAFVGVGQITSAEVRVRLFELLKQLGFHCALLQGSGAYVASSAAVGEGTLVGHMAVVNSGARIGMNCIINTHAVVEHDARIGDHVHLSSGAIINGESIVGTRCMIGSHATVNQGLRICDDVIVGAGATVVKNIEQPGVYVGTPARKLR